MTTDIHALCKHEITRRESELSALQKENAELKKDKERLEDALHALNSFDAPAEVVKLRTRISELEKDKARLDWLERLPTAAIWQGYFSDSDYNISLGRAGATICTVSTMDSDGTETDTEITGGDSLRSAIDKALALQPEK